MSFYITIKSAKLSEQHKNLKEKVSIVITSQNNRLFCTFVGLSPDAIWQDAFVAQGSERQLDFMLVKQKVPGKSAKRLSSGSVNLSKFLFTANDQTGIIFTKQIDEISLYSTQGKETVKLQIQVCYRQTKNFIGPIQFYKKSSGDFQQDQFIDLQVQGDDTRFPFWRRWLIGQRDTQANTTNMLQELQQKDKVKFYKGAHKNRNMFSLCDQVYDDQKFTVVENYYNDE